MPEINVPMLGDMPIAGVTMTMWGVDPQNVGKRIPVKQIPLPGITRAELAELVIDGIFAVFKQGAGTSALPASAWAETYWRDRQEEWYKKIGLGEAKKVDAKTEPKIKIAEA